MTKKPAAKRKAKRAVITAATPLSHREKLFVAYYCADLNGTKAAIKAGYAENSARVTASRMLTKANIAAAIEREVEARRAAIGEDAESLLKRLVAEANADVADIIDERGALKPVQEWPAIWRRGLVAGVKVTEMFETIDEERVHVGNIVEVKLADRAKRLEMFGRHRAIKAFKDNVNLTLGSSAKKFLERVTGDRVMPRQRVAQPDVTAGDDDA